MESGHWPPTYLYGTVLTNASDPPNIHTPSYGSRIKQSANADVDLTLPAGALDADARAKLVEDLTAKQLHWEGAPDKDAWCWCAIYTMNDIAAIAQEVAAA